MHRLIAFITDYGTEDGFVGVCHGVMAGIAPAHRVIDITHEVPQFDVRHGAVLLAQTVPYLPSAVVIGVVDPGVGTGRRRVAVVTERHVFVGPDNGLLLWAADAIGGPQRAYELTRREFWRETDAVTFDGRDVFAPVGAHIAAGVAPAEVGEEIAVGDLLRLPDPLRDVRGGTVRTEVLIIDRFGNVVLAARREDLETAGLSGVHHITVDVGGRRVVMPFGRTFSDAGQGDLLAYVDATGQVALAANQGSASTVLGLAAADQVTLAAAPR